MRFLIGFHIGFLIAPHPTRINPARMVTRARALVGLFALACLGPFAFAGDLPTEQSVMAAMVFNFLKFTEFPPEGLAGAPTSLRLCLAVQDQPRKEALGALAGRRVGGRELVVRDLAPRGGECDVFYVDTRGRWREAMDHPALQRALTISAYPGFVRDNGMIEINVRRDGVRFDINLAQARRAGVHFSPQLLRLARHIHD